MHILWLLPLVLMGSASFAEAAVRIDSFTALTTDSPVVHAHQWNHAVPAEKLYLARQFQGYIHYRATVFITEDDLHHTQGIYLAKVGDVDAVYCNGVFIGQTGQFPPAYQYAGDQYRAYTIPRPILHTGENELYIKAYVEYVTLKGVKPSQIRIGPLRMVQQLQYLSEWKARLTAIVTPMLAVMLALLTLPFRQRSKRDENWMLFVVAFLFILFGLSRSRLTFHLFSLVTAYKLHIAISLSAITSVALYTSTVCRHKGWRAIT